MRELPPSLERFLAKLGFNVTRLRWRLQSWENAWEGLRNRRWVADRHHKYCRHCGQLALASDRVCACGRRLPSYLGYRISRALALEVPEFRAVSVGFLATVVVLFVWQVSRDFPAALMHPTIVQDWRGRLSGPGVDFGALNIEFLREGQWWRLLGSALSHYGVIHILFNALAIAQMLPRLEDELGSWRTLLVLTLTQLGASAGVLIASPHAPTAGASGIAFGLIGFGLVFSHRRGRRWEMAFYRQWLIYGLVFTFLVPFISRGGHIGGVLAGLALGAVMPAGRLTGAAKAVATALGIVCLLLWTATIFAIVASVLNVHLLAGA
jgi:membrane associated rhomboid family serine protease